LRAVAVALSLIGMFVSACGEEDQARYVRDIEARRARAADASRAEAQAALVALRPAYTKRTATIDSLVRQARAWAGRPGVPPIALGDRPRPQFTFDRQTGAPAPGTNARILDAEGGSDFTHVRYDDLVQGEYANWRRDIDKCMQGRTTADADEVRAAYSAFEAVRYLALVIQDRSRQPQVHSDFAHFQTGLWQGRVLVADINDGAWVGGVEIAAENSKQVRSDTVPDASLTLDLQTNMRRAVDAALAGAAWTTRPTSADRSQEATR
jgi:hypothetical protein